MTEAPQDRRGPAEHASQGGRSRRGHARRAPARFGPPSGAGADASPTVVAAAGYAEVVPPIVEDLGVFLRVGEATDVVTKEMYDFTDKDGTQIALRPEMTAGWSGPSSSTSRSLPWKVWYAGTNFRHEKPQKGRYRSFDQVGVEALGVDDPDLDVEVIALGWRFFESLGLRQVRLLLNSLGEGEDRARYTEALRAFLEARAGDLSEEGRTDARPGTRCGSSIRSDPRIGRSSPTRPSWPTTCRPASKDALRAGAAPVSTRSAIPYDDRRPRLVRGLDYYRRTDVRVRRATRSTRRRTPSAAAAATTAWSRTSVGRRPPGIGFGSASTGSCWPATPRACSAAPAPTSTCSWSTWSAATPRRDLTHELRARRPLRRSRASAAGR